MKNCMAVSQKNLKIELPQDPAIPFLGLQPKELETGFWKDICTLTVSILTIDKRWNKPSCPLTDKGTNKIVYIHTKDYAALKRKDYAALKRKDYSALKRKKYATIWMTLEDIMLSEINQSQKEKYCMIPFIGGT